MREAAVQRAVETILETILRYSAPDLKKHKMKNISMLNESYRAIALNSDSKQSLLSNSERVS